MRADQELPGEKGDEPMETILDDVPKDALPRPTPDFRRESWRVFQKALDRNDVTWREQPLR
jgi:hypothetical protein